MTCSRTLRRSVRLLSAFRSWQSDPDRFYCAIAADAVCVIGSRIAIKGSLALDIGGGAGYFTESLRAAGARCYVADPDIGELSGRGERPEGAVIGDGYALPFRTGTADLVVCSNVLEHVARPYDLVDEMARITRPGGHLWVCFTNWYSPWGGHETSPWHYLGAKRAEDRFLRRNGALPKNRLGTT
ncbi:MAG: class I SAM-dependent methyltransferase, partial [Acidimicrobiales bacterium]